MIPIENRLTVFEDLTLNPNVFEKTLRVIHFNDVYNIDEHAEEPVGGASRFLTALNLVRNEKPALVVFSGDALSPSSISVFYKGKQIVDALNMLGIHAAAIGNHEFDMGLETLETRIKESTFPWLLSNVLDADTSKPLLNVHSRIIVEIEGVKVGLFGLAEKEWVCSLSCIDFNDVIYEPYIEFSNKMIEGLKKDGAQFIIAITHMRWKNDENLCKRVPGIDLVLGGHDHDYELRKANEKWILKSGTDFKEMSVVDFDVISSDKFSLKKIEKIVIDSKIPQDIEMKKIVDAYSENTSKLLDRELGHINAPLDGRYVQVRTGETNLGNFFCDIIMSAVDVDCCILNGGSLRSDRIHPPGPFTLRDLRDILSFESELVVVEITGEQLHELLENCLSKYEDIGGRFPQVSGIFFTYDPSRPPRDRVDKNHVKVQREKLDMKRKYSLATNMFLKSVDSVLKACSVKISHENIPQLHTLTENYFDTISKIKALGTRTKFLASIVSKRDEKDLIKQLFDQVMKSEQQKPNPSPLSFRTLSVFIIKTNRIRKNILLRKDVNLVKNSEEFKKKLQLCQKKSLDLKPLKENRSLKICDENKEILTYMLDTKVRSLSD